MLQVPQMGRMLQLVLVSIVSFLGLAASLCIVMHGHTMADKQNLISSVRCLHGRCPVG